jgi:transcriptional regulator with XRE-family HTH domain
MGYKIGDKIREYRKNLKMSQLEFALEIGVEQNTICQWETGNKIPLIPTLMRLADYFGLKLWEFLRDVDV